MWWLLEIVSHTNIILICTLLLQLITYIIICKHKQNQIVIMDDNMQPLAVLNNDESREQNQIHTQESAETQHNNTLTREKLLQKQRDLQTHHYQQSQALLQKHLEEKIQLMELQREGRLSSDIGNRMVAQMEETHDRELMELQNLHQDEQATLMEIIFESASSGAMPTIKSNNTIGRKVRASNGGKQKTRHELSDAAAQAKDEKDAVSSLVTAVIEKQVEEEQQPQPETPKSHAAGLWNRAAVATVAAKAMKCDDVVDVEDELTPRMSSSKPMPPPVNKAPPTLPTLEAIAPIKPTKQPLPSDKHRRREIQAVMKDKTLDKAEKQKRLAEIKAKYAAQADSQPKKVQETTNGVKNRWNRAAASAFAAQGFGKDFTALKQAEGVRTSLPEYTERLKRNDAELTTIILNGRKDVPAEEWDRLFDAIEDNSHLTHLSLVDCGLEDDVTTPLVLALVENETLTSLDLSNNHKLSNGTGKSLLKILKQSNQVLKKINLVNTTISDKTMDKIQGILDDRDDTKKLEKIQAARQKKIQELLAFSASDDVSPSSQRLSQRLLEIENEGKEGRGELGKSTNSRSTNSSGEHSKQKRGIKKNDSARSVGSGGSRQSEVSRSSTPTFKSAVRATATARAMATLGGDSLVTEQVKHTRQMRGECEQCGQKCFNKTMFKSIPLTIPGKVDEGECLRCST